MKRWKHARAARVVVFASFAALLALSVLAYEATRSLRQSRRDVAEIRGAIVAMGDLLNAVRESSNAMQGYIITGDDLFLSTFDPSIAEARSRVDQLAQQTHGVSSYSARVASIRTLIERRIELARSAVQARRRDSKNAADALIATLEGKRVEDEITRQIQQLRAQQTENLEAKLNATDASANRTFMLLGVAVFADFSLVVGLYVMIARELRSRELDTLRIQRDARRVRELYDKAPCGYFSVNAEGTVTFANDTLLKELGYSREEVEGRISVTEWLQRSDQEGFPVGFAEFKGSDGLSGREVTFLRRNGSAYLVSINASVMRNSAGEYVSCLATVFDIAERKQTEARIQQLNSDLQRRAEELELANRELEAFTYSVSHDLRAPLRHVNGFAEMLKDHLASTLDAEGRRYLERIGDGARNMSTLIDELLVFSRTARTEIRRQNVKLGTVVEEVCRSLDREVAGRQVIWKIGPLPEVSGDAALLRQVVFNLLANAAKYTRPRNPAIIEVGTHSRTPNEVVCFVRDNGVGFNMQYAPKLFGVFQRLHTASEFEGTGVGLAIVRRIVQRHGGRTWASGVEDEGATFYFSLPVPGEASVDRLKTGEPELSGQR